MRFAGSFGRREVKAVPATVQAMAASAQYNQLGSALNPYAANWDMVRAVREGLERCIWVFRSVHAMATDASRLPIIVREGDRRNGAEIDPNSDIAIEKLLYLLNEKPNVLADRSAQAFKYRMASQMLLSKKGIFIEIIEANGGWPAELYLLPPHLTAPIPDDKTFIKGYRVTLPGTNQGWIDLPPERVVWVKWDHPLDPYASLTPLEAAGISIDTDWYARRYNRNFVINDGRPGGILAIKGDVDPDDAQELEARFGPKGRAGVEGAGRVSVIEADDVDFVDTAITPRDAQYVQSRGITKEDILIAFGVPESRAGNASGRTFANADTELEIYWQGTEWPFLNLFEDGFNQLSEDGTYPVFDISSIPQLHRAQKEHDQAMQQEVLDGLRTANEYRRDSSGNLDEFEDDAANQLFYLGHPMTGLAAAPAAAAGAQDGGFLSEGKSGRDGDGNVIPFGPGSRPPRRRRAAE